MDRLTFEMDRMSRGCRIVARLDDELVYRWRGGDYNVVARFQGMRVTTEVPGAGERKVLDV
jgi:hypothetical protein